MLGFQDEILESLLLLMKTKGFNDISVSELCRKAGVSRMTYYRNYNRKEEVITRHLDTLFDQYVKEILALTFKTPYDFSIKFFSYFKPERTLIQCLARSRMESLILGCFERYLELIFQNLFGYTLLEMGLRRFEIEFISGGLYKTLIAWSLCESPPVASHIALTYLRALS